MTLFLLWHADELLEIFEKRAHAEQEQANYPFPTEIEEYECE